MPPAHLRHSVLGTTLLLLLMIIPAGTSAADARGAELSLQSEQIHFAYGEPVMILVGMVNETNQDLTDVAYLLPEVGHLAFVLEREGIPVKWTGPLETRLFVRPGCTVRRHSAMAEILDLADWFGVESEEGFRMLSPGHYRLAATFQLHLLDRGGTQIRLRSNTVSFDVGAEFRDHVGRDETRRILREAFKTVSKQTAIGLIPRAKAVSAPTYKAQLIRRFSPWMTKEEVISAAAEVEKAGSRYGCLLVLRSKLPQLAIHYDEGMAWLGRLRKAFPDEQTGSAVNWWGELVDQGHQYGNN